MHKPIPFTGIKVKVAEAKKDFLFPIVSSLMTDTLDIWYALGK